MAVLPTCGAKVVSDMPAAIITARAVLLDRSNVDTDQIIPVRFLTRSRAEGFADALFANLRSGSDTGTDRIDASSWAGRTILIAGRNFGCGSSREQAVWALMDAGFKAVIAESFSDIFVNNAYKNGLIAATVTADAQRQLAAAAADPELHVAIDPGEQTVRWAGGHVTFPLDPFWRDCLAKGWTETDITRSFSAQIDQFEQDHRAESPWSFHRDRKSLL
jgi:3-isopropylmalate/(R)-2-methylmalate dehydratase small subunit